ncbi:AI-2E family transporter [Adhaeribacter sp. BT258]|uniref:AI-2E family transporter n=1 Tax=Adhaeribacter terrigena TaxID=2793070 RepID=A0ABS1BZG1_9BACT|nr:AI-2E family transporter [Adhaeribacter terrigena]MBK0402552.1 AI-2E family transporter [Adhaeribacter terrigena]
MAKLTNLQRFNQILLALLLFFGLMKLASTFLIPIAIGGLFAMMLIPVSQKLESWGLSRLVAGLVCILTVLVVLIVVIFLMVNQLTSLLNDLPRISETMTAKLNRLHHLLATKINVSPQKQHEFLKAEVKEYLQSLSTYIAGFLRVTGTVLASFILTMVYAFFFLLYRQKLKNFVFLAVTSRIHASAHPIIGAPSRDPSIIISKITNVANAYVSGLFLVILILSAANTLGIYLIGIEHALFFGLMAGILNLLPYIGSILGSLVPILFAILTKDSLFYPLALIGFFIFLQMIESYVLTPNITGASIRLNPMVTLMGLLFGGFIWGIPGMILFIPYLGIVKVIFDHVKKLRPYGYLMGKDPGLDITK